MDPGNTEQNADDSNAELSSAVSFVSDSSIEGDISDSLLVPHLSLATFQHDSTNQAEDKGSPVIPVLHIDNRTHALSLAVPEDCAAQNVCSDYEPGEASQSLFHTNTTTVDDDDDDDVDDKLVVDDISSQDVSSYNVRATPEIVGSLFSPESGVAEVDMQVESQDESCSLEEDGLRKNISMLCDQLLTSPDTKEDVKHMNNEENIEQRKNAATMENGGNIDQRMNTDSAEPAENVDQRKNPESTGNDENIHQRKNTASTGNDGNIDQRMDTESAEHAENVDQRNKEMCTLSTKGSSCQKNNKRGRQTGESEMKNTQFAGPGDGEDIRVSAGRPGEEEISQQSHFTCPRPEKDDEKAEKSQGFSADLEKHQTCKGETRNSDFTKSITLSPKLQQTRKVAQKFKVPYNRKGIDPCSAEKDSRPGKDYLKCSEKERIMVDPDCKAKAIVENDQKRIVEENRIGEFSQMIYEATPKVSPLSGEREIIQSELITSKRSKHSGQNDSGGNGKLAGVVGYVQRDRKVVQRRGSNRISGRCNRDTAKIAHTEHDVIRDSADADVIGDEGSDVTLPPQSVKIRHNQRATDRDSQRSLESDSLNSKRLLDTVKDVAHKVSAERQDHTEEIVIIERIRHIYERASAAQVSANDQASLTQSLEKVIRLINKRQKEEKSALAERVKTGKMTPKEKGKTKQQLQNLSLRCTALQTLFKSQQMLKTKLSADAKKQRLKGLQDNNDLKKTPATHVAEDCQHGSESVCGKVSVMETRESQAENDLEELQGLYSGSVADGALHHVNNTENNMKEIQGPVGVSVVPGGALSYTNNTPEVVSSAVINDNTNKSSVASRCSQSSQKSCPLQGVSVQGRQNTENADEYLDSDSQISQSILHPNPAWKRPKNTSVPALPSSKTEIHNVSKVASPAERSFESATKSTKSRSKKVQEELTETTGLVSRPVSESEREVTPDERHSTSPRTTQTFTFVEQDPVTASTNSTAKRKCQSSKVSASSPKSLTNLKGIDARPRNESIVSNYEEIDERSEHNADNLDKDDLEKQIMNATNADIAASEIIQLYKNEAATVRESVDFMETQDPALGRVLDIAVSPRSQTEPMDGLIENISSTIQTHTFDTLTVPFDCNSQSSVIADFQNTTPLSTHDAHLSQHSELVSQSILQQVIVTASTAMFDAEREQTQQGLDMPVAICNPVSQCFEDDDDRSDILIDCIQRERKPIGNDAIGREDFVGQSRVPKPCSGINRTKCPVPQNNSQSSKSSSSSRKRSRSSSSSQGVGSDRENAARPDNASPIGKSQRMNSLPNNERHTSTLPASASDPYAISTATLEVSREAREHVPTAQTAEGMIDSERSGSGLHKSTEGSSKTASTLQNTTASAQSFSTQKYRSARTEDITNSASQSQPSILSVSVNAQGSVANPGSNTEAVTPVSAEKRPVKVIIVNCSSKVDVGSKSLLQTKVAQMTPSTLEKPKCATPRPAQTILSTPTNNLACTPQQQLSRTPAQSLTPALSQNLISKQPQNTDTPRDITRKPTQLGPMNSAPQPIPRLTAPRRPSSPSSTVTSMTMTDVFPVSSREILRKMAEDTVSKQKEAITKQPAADLRQRETDSYQNEAASGDETEPGSKGADPRPLGGRSTQHTEASRVYCGDRERAIRRLGPGDTRVRRDVEITGDVYSDIASLGSAAREGETSWPPISQSGSKLTRPGPKFGKEPNETLPKKTAGGGMSTMPPRYRELIDSGVILPGRLCLSVHEKGREKKASIMTDGRIEDSAGLTFANPLSWYRAVSGLPRIKRSSAYSKISYKGHSLAVVCGRTHLPSPNPTSSNTTTSNATARTATANPNIAETITATRLPQERSAIHQDNPRHLSGACSKQAAQLQENTGVHKSSLPPPTQTTVSSLDAGIDAPSPLRADKMLSSLRKLRLVADEEVASHSADCELTSFWSADFAKITMSQNFWATVDDWD